MTKSLPARQPRPRFAILLLVLFLVLFLTRATAVWITDWLWFREIDFERVFLLQVTAKWILGGLAGLGGFVILYMNARIAMRGIENVTESVHVLAEGGIVMRERLFTRLAQMFALPIAVVGSVLLGLSASAQWRTLVQFVYRTPFGETDPIFGRDVAYYVFTLPMIEMVLGVVTATLVLALIVFVLPIYFARGDLFLRDGHLRVAPALNVHVAVIVALLLFLQAVRLLLISAPSLLFGVHSPLQGASLTDLTIVLPSMRALSVLLALGAGVVIWAARRDRLVPAVGAVVGGYVILSVLMLGVIPSAYQRLVVQPNELARETPQIIHHIAATRRAWGLDSVQRRELGGNQELTAADLNANRATIDNVRLWDRAPLLRTFGQLQSIRTYYEFVAVDDDRYMVDGQLRHVLLSARELDAAALPTRTFVNEHLTFTHGMGLTMGPTNEVTAEGLPVLWVKDLPPASSMKYPITRPQIYFGELTDSYVLAPSRQREFDHPSAEGDEGVYSRYEGTAGVSVSALWQRALFALRFRSMNILLSSDLTESTKVLFNRNVTVRAEAALPFLRFDSDPYIVVTDSGRLVWLFDAYTATNRYPYSARLADGTNYMRNSVKVTIDAYDGEIKAYISEPDDPMVQTLAKIYPGLLRPLDEIPADLRAHLRYPEALFSAQTQLYATFQMTDAETFYHREDQWQIPATQQQQGDRSSSGYVRHIVMRLPGETETEYVLMRPFTPRQKDNLAAWMVARSDGEHYGELIAYRFPRQSLIFGPTQVAARINQDTEVSQQISLWDQGGSAVIRGELLVIPIESSLLYVQPIYLQAQGGRIPELKRVVVAHEGRVAMEETFERGLRALFGDEAVRGSASARSSTAIAAAATSGTAPSRAAADDRRAELATQALQHYDRARSAQRADDWANYGKAMQQLGEVLRQLRELGPPR